MNPGEFFSKSLPRASRSDVLIVTFGSRQILAGLFPSAKKRQPAAVSPDPRSRFVHGDFVAWPVCSVVPNRSL